MAGADYRSCDLCGSKTFYDAELSYDYEEREGRPFVRDSEYNLGYLGDWACICIACAKTHRVVIEKIDAAMQQPGDAKQRLLEIMRRNGLATGHGDTLKQVIDTLEVELTDVLSAARQNAARYRWLRDVSDTEFMEELSDTFFGEWDAVIDAAMQQEQT